MDVILRVSARLLSSSSCLADRLSLFVVSAMGFNWRRAGLPMVRPSSPFSLSASPSAAGVCRYTPLCRAEEVCEREEKLSDLFSFPRIVFASASSSPPPLAMKVTALIFVLPVPFGCFPFSCPSPSASPFRFSECPSSEKVEDGGCGSAQPDAPFGSVGGNVQLFPPLDETAVPPRRVSPKFSNRLCDDKLRLELVLSSLHSLSSPSSSPSR